MLSDKYKIEEIRRENHIEQAKLSGRTSIHRSPSPQRRAHTSEEQITDDEDENNFRYENANFSDDNNDSEYNSSDISYNNLSRSQHDLSNIKTPETKFKPQCKSDMGTICFSLVMLAIILVIFATFIPLNASKPITITYLRERFPTQPPQTFKNIETIINDVLSIEPIHPAVFLFLYKKNTRHGNFIESIAQFASHKLQVTEEHITLNERDYVDPKVLVDYGYLIHKYKPELMQKKVMVIQDLHKMSGNTAQALHSFCDEYNPLVDRTVYILTLEVDTFQGNENHIAEKRLEKAWSDLDNDTLAPLITRVTSTVIKIY